MEFPWVLVFGLGRNGPNQAKVISTGSYLYNFKNSFIFTSLTHPDANWLQYSQASHASNSSLVKGLNENKKYLANY